MLEKTTAIQDIKAIEIMTPHPSTISSDTLAVKALEIMREKSISQIVIVENDKYKGIVHLHDLIKEGII